MKPIDFDDYAAFIGLDWADSKHDVCLQEAGSQRSEFSVIQHTPEAIQQWALGLLERFDSRPVALCCELKKGPLINALAKYPHIVMFRFQTEH